MAWHFIGLFVMVVIYCIFRYRNDDDEKTDDSVDVTSAVEDEPIEVKNMEEGPKTKDLAREVIRSIGCTLKETEDGRIQFEYQGVAFLMETVDECLFVNLIWPWCYSFSKFDIDEFARVRQVVNDVNAWGAVSVFYTISDSDEVAVHIKKNFVLVPQIPGLGDYLKSVLDRFFRTARTLDLEIEKSRLQEMKG